MLEIILFIIMIMIFFYSPFVRYTKCKTKKCREVQHEKVHNATTEIVRRNKKKLIVVSAK